MKTARLKNIVILLLVLLNAFLLFLLLSRRMEARNASDRALRSLTELYAKSGITLPASVIPEEVELPDVDPLRDTAAELAFAGALLGQSTARDAGGGIHRYTGEHGECLFRASGTVESELSRAVEDPAAFSESFFDTVGYAPVELALQDGSGTASAVRMLERGAVFNARLTLRFEGGTLTGVSGSFLPAVTAYEAVDGPDAVTALMRFLDYCGQNGVVCTEILSLEQGYLLLSSASVPARLVPVWRVGTDVNNYYVNYLTGEVTRE